jgi:phosphatidylserine decarboxylase
MSEAKSNKVKEIYYYDREKKVMCRENVMGDAFIKWAYHALSGKLCHIFLYRLSLFSRLLGWYFDTGHSKRKITAAVKDLGIETSEFLLKTGESDPVRQYRSFNDFFYRHLKPEVRPFSDDTDEICCPADGRVLVYPNADKTTAISVKGCETRLSELFEEDITVFTGCDVAVIRLCPADYHRFHFPCAGELTSQRHLKGQYHSVNPVALNAVDDVFILNKRDTAIIKSDNFGLVGYVEVGAFGVGGIVQTYSGRRVSKMQEKGYFKFGGSTVVLVFEGGKVSFCNDLLEKSREGVETLVKVGQPLANKIK